MGLGFGSGFVVLSLDCLVPSLSLPLTRCSITFFSSYSSAIISLMSSISISTTIIFSTYSHVVCMVLNILNNCCYFLLSPTTTAFSVSTGSVVSYHPLPFPRSLLSTISYHPVPSSPSQTIMTPVSRVFLEDPFLFFIGHVCLCLCVGE